MSDLTERLRSGMAPLSYAANLQAADEIERLTTEVIELGRRRRALWDELVKVHTNEGCGLGEAQIFADIAEAHDYQKHD